MGTTKETPTDETMHERAMAIVSAASAEELRWVNTHDWRTWQERNLEREHGISRELAEEMVKAGVGSGQVSEQFIRLHWAVRRFSK
tara:strand:+ start:94 stop:351 length:258 start_codon:yes stop_codon:yes gene_type:complete